MEKFIFGLAVGMAGGALLVANNCKLLNLVKKNQEDLMQKAENYIDEKSNGVLKLNVCRIRCSLNFGYGKCFLCVTHYLYLKIAGRSVIIGIWKDLWLSI